MTNFYAQEDDNGKTGQPGQVKSYDLGYITTSNAELEAQERGQSLEEYLKDLWENVSMEAPWTWETLGSGYGFHGTTIFSQPEPDGGTLRCKEIFDQIMFDVYPPQEQPQPEQPIALDESDIKAMIFEGAMCILKEEHGTAYGAGDWMPFTEFDDVCREEGLTEDVAEKLIADGIIPDALNRDFMLQASCPRKNMFDPSCGPTSSDGEKSCYGEYDEAKALIDQVKDERIKGILLQSLQAACDAIECDDFQPDEPDPDERYESRRDMDEIGGSYQKLPFEEPQPTEPAKQWSGLYEGRAYDTWIGHSDIPGSDGRFYNIEFSTPDGGKTINYRILGDTKNGPCEPYVPGDEWQLHKEIMQYIQDHMGTIKANLFV